MIDAADFYRDSLKAAQELGQRALLLIGHARNRPREPLPPGNAVFEYATFGEVLPRASIIVHQGGVGTTGQGLSSGRPVLIVRGQANLIDFNAAEDRDRVRRLLDELEDRQEIARLLESARDAPGCRIFIGSENRMFALSGSSVIAAPYRGSHGEVVGVVGVIGPTRLNYARVVPMVDFTAKALTRLMA